VLLGGRKEKEAGLARGQRKDIACSKACVLDCVMPSKKEGIEEEFDLRYEKIFFIKILLFVFSIRFNQIPCRIPPPADLYAPTTNTAISPPSSHSHQHP